MQIAQALRQTTKPFVSLEFFPPAAESHLPEFYETVERLRSIDPLFLSVTYGAGGGKQQNTLNVTAELARRGFTVMAHLTCVGAEPQAISDCVSHLRAAGVHNVLALRGDAPRGVSDWDWNAGHFHNARDLVRFLRSGASPTWASVWRAIPRPIPMRPPSRRTGPIWPTSCAPERISSSPSFSSMCASMSPWSARCAPPDWRRRSSRASCPSRASIPCAACSRCAGPTSRASSIWNWKRPTTKAVWEAVREAGLRFAARQIRQLLDCGAPGIHLYSLNKSEMCLRLVEEAGL